MRALLSLIAIAFLVVGCNFPSAVPTVPPTDEPTLTLAATATVIPTLPPTFTATVEPSATPIPSPTTPPTPIYTPSLPPPPATPTSPPAPTAVPYATPAFVGDRLRTIELSKAVRDGVGKQWVSFIALNDTRPTGTPGTLLPQNDTESIYLASDSAGQRNKIIDLPASTDRRVYWSPNGAYLAYILADGEAPGLYMLDLRNATSLRLFAMRDFTPRGFAFQPVWSPDSKQLILMMPTAYDFDIYAIQPDSSNFVNLTENGAYDLWPSLSSDGAYLAFVSDRAACPSWQPNAPKTCNIGDARTPEGGQLYIMDMATRQIKQLSDQFVNTPPRWITPNRLAFTTASPIDPTVATGLWWADLRGGTAFRVSGSADSSNPATIGSDAWSLDGDRVIYQESNTSTRLIARDDKGQELGRNTDLNFPRFLFVAGWSPDGSRVVLGGRNGQCPFGMIIADTTLKPVVNVQAGPGVCEPTWSPDGRFIAYVGTARNATSRDGRVDIYVSEANGLGARLLTSRISGQIKLLGWIKGGG